MDAIRTGERGLALDEDLLRRRPGDLVHRQNVGAKSMNLGLDLGEQNRIEEAIRALKRSCQVYAELCAELDAHPEQAAKLADPLSNPRSRLAQSELNFGLLLIGDHQFADGRKRLLAAAEQSRRVAADNPTVRSYREVLLAAETHAILAGLELGAPAAELLHEAEHAMETGIKLASDDATNPTYKARLGHAHAAHGAILARLGRNAEANAAWADAEKCLPKEVKNALTLEYLARQQFYLRALGKLALRDAPAAASDVQRFLEGPNIVPSSRVSAARVFAQCAAIAAGAEKKNYQDRALAELHSASKAGYRNVGRFAADPNLAPLRTRNEFEMIVGRALAKP